MKLLIYSPAFLPRIGGLELQTAQLAAEMTRLGCEVTVVTQTEAQVAQTLPYRVVRRPWWYELLRWALWCDIYYQANVSLRGLWPLLLVRRPWVVSHHSWYRREDGRLAWQDRLKRFLLRFAKLSIAVSESMAADLETPSIVIANSYRDDLFRILGSDRRPRDLVFLGRLVSDKGVDLLIEALGLLAGRGLHPSLTILGEGPEKGALTAQVARLGLQRQVEILGMREDDELVSLLNQHRIMVIPSRYNEPFGIVALEGIACGCVIVGSSGGGLPEAIGPCGRTFPNGDAEALAQALTELLNDPAEGRLFQQHAPKHLAEHKSERVSQLYLAAFQAALRRVA